MLEGKTKYDWVHTTHVLVTLCNVNRDGRTDPLRFEDVYPFAAKRTSRDVHDMDALRTEWRRLSGEAR